MADPIFDWTVVMPILQGKQERQIFRALQQNQRFIVKFVDTKVPQRFVLRKFHNVLERTDISGEV